MSIILKKKNTNEFDFQIKNKNVTYEIIFEEKKETRNDLKSILI